MRGHDLTLASAGAAFYGGLTVVPSVLVAVSLAQLVLGRDRLHGYGSTLAQALPSAIGADTAAQRLVDAGRHADPARRRVRGRRRVGVRRGHQPGAGPVRTGRPDEKPRRLLLRAATLPMLGLAPLLLASMLLVAPWLARTAAGSGAGVALASYVSLNIVWVPDLAAADLDVPGGRPRPVAVASGLRRRRRDRRVRLGLPAGLPRVLLAADRPGAPVRRVAGRRRGLRDPAVAVGAARRRPRRVRLHVGAADRPDAADAPVPVAAVPATAGR